MLVSLWATFVPAAKARPIDEGAGISVPLFLKTRVGDVEVISLLDGHRSVSDKAALRNTPAAELKRVLADQGAADVMDMSIPSC